MSKALTYRGALHSAAQLIAKGVECHSVAYPNGRAYGVRFADPTRRDLRTVEDFERALREAKG